MKKMKKLVGLLLMFVMVMAMAVTASAGDYSITITNSSSGHTYGAYQIFTGTLSSDSKTLSDIQWGSNVDSSTILDALKTADSATYGSCSSAQDVANALTQENIAAFADIIGVNLKGTAVKTTSDHVSSEKYVISGLDAGYYLVKDEAAITGYDAATDFIIEVVADAEATPKSSVPSVTKSVKEDTKYLTSDGYNDVADYSIGDTIYFQLTGTMPSTLNTYSTYAYTFHDEMSDGLTFGSVTSVKIDDIEVSTNSYSVTQNTSGDGCDFHVVFSDILSAKGTDNSTSITVSASSKVVVTYTATLNSSAVIGLDGNENAVYLEFSNNPTGTGTGTTPKDKVIVFTYELDVTKVDGSDTDTKLQNAKFLLYKLDDEGKKHYVKVDSNYKVTGWTDADSTDGASTLTSDVNGLFKVIGLNDGTYYLQETEAPDGYNKLTKDITLVISGTTVHSTEWNETPSTALTEVSLKVDSETAVDNGTTGKVSTQVKNYKGAEMPETGGMGTTILYVIGTILVLGAAILLVTKKRMSAEK